MPHYISGVFIHSMSPQTLTRDTAGSTLKVMLEEAGLTLDALDLEKTWDVFIEFCKIPIESETDDVIIQWSETYKDRSIIASSKEDKKLGFSFSILRQFDDDSMEFEQLTLEWHYPINDFLDQSESGNSGWCFAEGGCNTEGFIRTQQEGRLFQFLKLLNPSATLLFQDNTG